MAEEAESPGRPRRDNRDGDLDEERAVVDWLRPHVFNIIKPFWPRPLPGPPLPPSPPIPGLPPGAAPQRIALPAFWTLEPNYDAHWAGLQKAAAVMGVTVIEESWPELARKEKTDPASTWVQKAQTLLAGLPGTVLGYVPTRDTTAPYPLFDITQDIMGDAGGAKSVQAWYDEFGQQIDGIYFDQVCIPDVPNSFQDALNVAKECNTRFPNGKVMVLGGQCNDEDIITSLDIDWVLLWEDTFLKYQGAFTARIGAQLQHVPSWWKNPAYRKKIAHVVHGTAEVDRQHALGLANERNAGLVFVMQERGLNPDTGTNELYDRLPPPTYWDREIIEVGSYYDFGFDPQRALQAAHLYAVQKPVQPGGPSLMHGWPNFEMAWYAFGHVRGTFLLEKIPHGPFSQFVPRVDLADARGEPPLHDIPRVFAAADKWAKDVANNYETAMPTFRQGSGPTGPTYELVVFPKGLAWLHSAQVDLGATYQMPTFAEPGVVFRNINRAAPAIATKEGRVYKAAFPTFVPDDPVQFSGRKAKYNFYYLDDTAPVAWEDVLTSTYLSYL